MAEYIDKADLVKRLESRVKDYGRDCNSNAPIISRTYQAVLHMVENLPTADFVEVVRCKDCKHWGGVVFGYRCRKFSGMNTQIQTSENDFCSFGERKEGIKNE